MEKFIQLPDGSTAFITGCPDDSGCDHDWSGGGLITFGNSELTMTDKAYGEMYHSYTENEWKEFHKDKGSITSQCTCSKCGMPYMQFDNPYYH